MMLGMIGLPVPDELLMTFAGYLIFKGKLVYWITLIVACLGSISGVSFSFFLGHKWGLPLLEKHGRKIHMTPERLEKSEIWFKRFGKFAVTFSYFIPGVRHFTAISAGISRWKYRIFLLYAVPGGIAWAFTFITLGYYLGENWRVFTETFHRYMLYTVLGLVIGLGIWLAIRRKRNPKQMKAETPTPIGSRSRSFVSYEFIDEMQKHPDSAAFIDELNSEPQDQGPAPRR
ncbi:DedA family protein [Ferviditalea candida]|uniref:DedA family protein n=1 Tax=Ferviditalea candida TaxID=3108399 RepID=A0ABU5ZEM8_9BACL|nr:DedA family protein [Paenibacillaceae bacterium T2]